MTLAHQPIVARINRRRSRQRILAPVWEMAVLFVCVFAATGLVASLGYACADLGIHPVESEYKRDSDVLQGLLNGTHYRIDHNILFCTIIGRRNT